VPQQPDAVRPRVGATFGSSELPGPQPGMAAVCMSAAQLPPLAEQRGAQARIA